MELNPTFHRGGELPPMTWLPFSVSRKDDQLVCLVGWLGSHGSKLVDFQKNVLLDSTYHGKAHFISNFAKSQKCMAHFDVAPPPCMAPSLGRLMCVWHPTSGCPTTKRTSSFKIFQQIRIKDINFDDQDFKIKPSAEAQIHHT